jgi:sec-independent protein translocase protein TatA
MDLFSIWHWLIVGAVLLLLFGGRGRISEVMGDVAKGIKAFKSVMADTADASTTTMCRSNRSAVNFRPPTSGIPREYTRNSAARPSLRACTFNAS